MRRLRMTLSAAAALVGLGGAPALAGVTVTPNPVAPGAPASASWTSPCDATLPNTLLSISKGSPFSKAQLYDSWSYTNFSGPFAIVVPGTYALAITDSNHNVLNGCETSFVVAETPGAPLIEQRPALVAGAAAVAIGGTLVIRRRRRAVTA